jgi:glycosyltransferase involved in cell wall biosynthesis
MPLKIAAKVDPVDVQYFEHAVRPHLEHPLIEFVGEIGEADKEEFLGNAYAYLFPIDWPEPFGLTMIEAMACGTPVIAMNVGAVGEVVADGSTGFVCESFRAFLDAVSKVETIDRANCRAHVEANFSAAAMASQYEALYRRLLAPTRVSDQRLIA